MRPAARKTPARAGRRRAAAADPAGERLTRERILAEALALIDARGVDAFNLRDLAARLGVYPAAIYWHVSSRNQLVAGAIELAMSGLAPDPTAVRWQDRIRSVFVRYREALRVHPNLAPVVGGQLLYSTLRDPTLLEAIVVALEDAGFADAALADAYNVVLAAMAGFPTLELAVAPAEKPEAWADDFRQRLAAIPRDRFPALGRHLDRLADRAFVLRWSGGREKPLQSAFEAWADVVIAGLEARLPKGRSSPAKARSSASAATAPEPARRSRAAARRSGRS